MNKKEWGDHQIRDYLLGRLPESETEELDELSVADDEFAVRLQAAENELLDSYLKGEISEPNLRSFKSNYLAYPPRREKVRIAKAFHSLVNKESIPEASTLSVPAGQRIYWLAAAAIVLFLATGYLTFQTIRLRKDVVEQRAELEALRAQERELQEQLEQQIAANKEAKDAKENDSRMQIAMNLPPATRGISKIPILEVPAGTVSAMLTLELETNRFPGYQVELKDPTTDKVLWRSEALKAGKAIPIEVPVDLFRTQHYQLELYGVPGTGGSEFVAEYPFTVIRK